MQYIQEYKWKQSQFYKYRKQSTSETNAAEDDNDDKEMIKN